MERPPRCVGNRCQEYARDFNLNDGCEEVPLAGKEQEMRRICAEKERLPS